MTQAACQPGTELQTGRKVEKGSKVSLGIGWAEKQVCRDGKVTCRYYN